MAIPRPGGSGLCACWVIPVLLSPIIGRFAHKLDMRRLVTFSFIMYAVLLLAGVYP